MRSYDWAVERAKDFFTRAPRFRNAEVMAHEMQQAFFAGLKAASDYHTKQAATMRLVLTDIERGAITSADAGTVRKWISHHDHCAGAVKYLDPS